MSIIQPILRAKHLVALSCVLGLALAACDGSNDTCGDLVCDGNETATSCPSDCGCGNGVANSGEECDGDDLGDATCMSATGRGGNLRCSASCTLDVSGCTLASCGNGVAEDDEVCDGVDLGGKSCTSIGFAGGDLACKTDCVFDTSTCCTHSCPAAGMSECIGDTLRSCAMGASGCLAWQVVDCAATGDVCQSSAPNVAACTCVDRCVLGEQRCEGASIETCAEIGGCLQFMPTIDCAASQGICAVAPSGPICAADVSAEDCADPYPLQAGSNVVAWTATNADYLLSASCESVSLTGPDVVMSYTAPDNGFVRFSMAKPASARQVIVASAATCGTTTPEAACASDFSPTTLSTELAVAMGTTYHFYVRDTTSGAAPLDNPLFVTLEETLCSTITPAVTTLSPPNGASVPNLTPILRAEVDLPIDPSAGVITLTGTLGTSRAYDLATGPAEIAIINGGRTLIIDPGLVFPASEILTVSWSGLVDSTCGKPIASPTWSFQVTGPPCAPGVDGMVGNTITLFPTGLGTITENYVAADDRPNGFVYVGGATTLHRMPKSGGPVENVVTAAGLSSIHLGFDMVTVGDEVYTLESNTNAATNQLFRITTNAGATWTVQNYAQFPQTPNDDLRGITFYKGRLYMTTDESIDPTQIWSIPASSSTLPELAVLEAEIPDEDFCTGVAVDDHYFYLACSNDDRLLRVDRVTKVKEVITNQIDININKNVIHAHDIDNDGRADVLYVQTGFEQVHYVCDPNTGTGPFFVDVLASFGTGSSNFGLGFDPVSRVLWMFDDDTRELVKIE
jgi:hypothetical protein